MSIAITPPNNSYYHRKKNLRWAEKKRSFIGILRKPATKNAVFVSLQMPLTRYLSMGIG
jgi:hypothetical protein